MGGAQRCQCGHFKAELPAGDWRIWVCLHCDRLCFAKRCEACQRFNRAIR
jgi:hypothetical protein